MSKLNNRSKVALLSVSSNTLLIIIKIVAGILSGSVSIISEAVHSAMDLVASIIAFVSVIFSSKPADKKHPYGHGKIENISGAIEGLLIFVAAGMIIYEAVHKIINPVKIEQEYVAIAVMLMASTVNFFVSKILYKTAKKEDSMALEADALHLKTDVYTSLGVGIGLILIKVTKLAILDPIVAILVALLILTEAWKLCKNAFEFLIDVKLTDAEEQQIDDIIKTYSGKIYNYHKLKTRKSGNKRYIDFHIVVDPNMTVKDAHEIVGNMKKDITQKFGECRVSIHIDPKIEEESDNSNDET